MELNPNSARITSLATSFDPPEETSNGFVRWATVHIEYTLSGLAPTVDIRVPLAFDSAESEAERHAQALRVARLLIDHACRAVGAVPEESAAGVAESLLECAMPPALEGISQELGIANPTIFPKQSKPPKG